MMGSEGIDALGGECDRSKRKSNLPTRPPDEDRLDFSRRTGETHLL